MSDCDECGEPTGVLPFECERCGKQLCSDCRLPEYHRCESEPVAADIREGNTALSVLIGVPVLVGLLLWRAVTTAIGVLRKVASLLLRPSSIATVLLVASVVIAGAAVVDTGIGPLDRAGESAAGHADNITSTDEDGIDEELAEQEFVERLNAIRGDEGEAPVGHNGLLSEMADSHSQNMAEHDYIGHVQPDGTTIEDRYRANGLLPECEIPDGGGFYYAGAEVAAGAVVDERVTHPGTSHFFDIDDEETLSRFLMSSWLTSDGHREIILHSRVNEVGLGVTIRDDGEVFAVAKFC